MGELLERVYLEIKRAVTLEDQGGAKIRIQNIDLKRCDPEATGEGPAFIAHSEWVAIGEVTHWAHTHTRLDRYQADLTLAPRDGRWIMTDLQILGEESEVQ